ncbi:MAG TPA: protein kinase [Thermoanaerobaculia bacterium]|jgi:serine/threonine-protein kinase|nr:protein kinase [Thermoanaerobaculia bacterium]
MINASTESRLLRLAIAKGLLTWGELDDLAVGLPDEDAGRRSWLDLLLASGRLDQATVDTLLAELRLESPEPPEPITGPQTAVPYPPELRFLRGWPRYRLERQLGAGGMGTVFLAWDPSLSRRVALKFLHRNEPQQTERFLREARSQARVEHPNICKVHEVGEVDGRPYIAMQLIEGKNLSELRGELSVEEMVRLLRDVARAIQAAHRSGLIHRDLKPANILVGTDDAGRRQPFVVDFGLAQDQTEESLTRTGMISGTPSYLSPEQAQGIALDRRSDVYSLGIVLYELLAGQPPFVGPNPAHTLVRVLQEDAKPLRKAAPSVPQDLETIVMKCIEKEPDRRYDSARALADDLERWLDGEPIQARRAGWTYRLGKKLWKHRALTTVAGAAAIALVVLTLGLLRTRMQAQERAALAQRFGQRVSDVESGLRFAALLPRHDMTSSKRKLRRELEQIEEEMKRLGPLAQGPGCYVLGKGYLALHQVESARESLECAWQAGEHGPEVAAALGRAFGFLYEKALVDATQPNNGRQAVREDAERNYRRPALSYLKEATDTQRSPYLAGLTAFYEGRYDEAVAQAREAYHQTPWFYEAAQLEAEVYWAQAEAASDAGRREEALRFFDRAGEAYSRLLLAVPSDAALYAADCSRQQRRIEVERGLRAIGIQDQEDKALATCGWALEVDPELGDALVSQAAIYWVRGDQQSRRGIDPLLALGQSIALAEKAITLDPRDAAAHKNLAIALRLQGYWELAHGADPAAALARSVAAAQRAVELQPELATNHSMLGLSWLVIAQDRQRRGGDIVPAVQQSIASFDRAVALNAHFLPALGNLGSAWNILAEIQTAHGADPSEATAKAIAAFEKAEALSPGQAPIHNNLGNTYLTLGEYQLARGADPRPALEKAASHYARAIQIKPDYPYGPYNLAYAERLLAEALVQRGEDPAPALRAANAQIAAAFKINPDDSDTWLEQARVRLIEARWAERRKQNPAPALEQADAALQHAEAVNPGAPAIYLAEAQVQRQRAETALARGGDPRDALRLGLDRLDKALAIHPDEPEALALRGTLTTLTARRETAAQAGADLEKAIRLNPLLQREYGPVLDQARKLMAGGL